MEFYFVNIFGIFYLALTFAFFSNPVLNTLSSYDNGLCFVWVCKFVWQFKEKKRSFSGKSCCRNYV